MGKVFYDMGLLSQAKVEECSATDLIGQYVGQTGPKVQKVLESAMGRVLFIDEAYRLAEGGFATEAMDELVDCMTKPKFARKLIIILAGYDKDINRLMSMNPGLTSRFPDSIVFKHMAPKTCLELLVKILTDLKIKKKAPLDLTIITPPSSDLQQSVLSLFSDLSRLESWGNARDVKSLAKSIFGKLISTAVRPITSLVLTEDLIIGTMRSTLKERSQRAAAVGTSRFQNENHLYQLPVEEQQTQVPTMMEKITSALPADTLPKVEALEPPVPNAAVQQEKNIVKVKSEEPQEATEDYLEAILQVKRDPGVSDAVWEQLERDKHALIERESEYKRRQAEKRKEEQRIKDLIRAEKAAVDEEERRQLELKRIEAALERRRKDEELAAIERERAKEMLAQKRIRMLGPCPMGFHWIKGSGGYRCAGGSHWLSDAALDGYVG